MAFFTEEVTKNIELNKNELLERRTKLDSFPIKIYVEPTQRCNLNCWMCDWGRRRSREDMDLALFEKIEKELFPHVAEVDFFLNGEPLIGKHFSRMIETSKRYSFLPKIFTNGLLLDEEKMELLVTNGVFVNISFDGGHTDRIVGDASAPNALTEDDMEWAFTAGADDFITLTPGPHSDPTANGFLQLVSNSPLVDAGVKAEGIRFADEAPDLGAVELNMTETGAVKKIPAVTGSSHSSCIRVILKNRKVQYELTGVTDVGVAGWYDSRGKRLGSRFRPE